MIFVVLVYRNTKDLEDFFKSNHVKNTHTIVVVSHYDELSDGEFKRISTENNADIIIVPNKGYGAGNNKGIEYALRNYDFDFLIVSNADITIRHLDKKVLQKYQFNIIAPQIIAANGKRQNPNEPYKPSDIAYKLMYKIYCGEKTKLIWFFYGLARLRRIFYNLIGQYFTGKEIFSAHGSFVIFPIRVLKELVPLYNEKMFLMNEESHLALKAREAGVNTIYLKDIVIDHKEDGSMSLEYKNEWPLLKQSFTEFYRYWYK